MSKRSRNKSASADRELQKSIRRASDEELLSRSQAIARRSPTRVSEIEELIRRYRRKK